MWMTLSPRDKTGNTLNRAPDSGSKVAMRQTRDCES